MQQVTIGERGVDQERYTVLRYRLEPRGHGVFTVRFAKDAVRAVRSARRGGVNRLCELTIDQPARRVSVDPRALQRVAQRSTEKITVVKSGQRIFIDSPNAFTKQEIIDLVELLLKDLEMELSAPARATTQQRVARAAARDGQTVRRSSRPRRDPAPDQARRM